ncbi:MAG TPA: DUF1345 domain-containing protein [Enterovirga sp.]
MVRALPLRAVTARPRLLISAGLVLAVGLLLPGELRVSTRFLIAWDTGIVLYLVLICVMMARSDHDRMQRRADEEDAGAAAVLALTIAAAIASFVAIGAELHGADDAGGARSAGRLALTGTTILVSWLFVHVMFALHYAHDYYAGAKDRGGLKFPGDQKPDYWDFLYFSFNLGAAAQTSDVMIEAARMRRFVLVHTILSFLFNTTILAMAINVGAGLL